MNKPDYPHSISAREGWPFVAGAGLVALLTMLWSGWVSLLFWVIALSLLFLFRDPARLATDAMMAVVAPADGRIVAIEAAQDPYAAREAVRIGIATGLLNPYAHRAPIDGEVCDVQYFPRRVNLATPGGAARQNDCNAMVLRSPRGDLVTVVQKARRYVSAIFCYAKKGDTLKRGQRYGFIRFGACVDVYLPRSVHLRVALGDPIRATSTVLADLPVVSDSLHV